TGYGSEPNRRTFTSSSASALVKPPSPPAEISTLPPGIASRMTGAEITVLSRTIAKYSWRCAAVQFAKRSAPFDFRVKLTVRWPCWFDPTFAVSSSAPPKRTHGAVGDPEVGHVVDGF